MLKKLLLTLPAALVLLTGCGHRNKTEEEPIPPIGFRATDYLQEGTVVEKGETFVGLLQRIGLSREDANTICARCDTFFRPSRLRQGVRMDLYYTKTDSLLAYAVYNDSRIKKTVFKCTDSLQVWNHFLPVTVEQRVLDVEIHNSLWQDIVDSGGQGDLAMKLDDIFEWSVNFFSLRDGDHFKVVYDEAVCDGEVLETRRIHFARYVGFYGCVNAVYVDIPGERNQYFNEKGDNLRKAFLKAPLKFSRISSKFTYHRKHPVTGKVKAHTGVDYAAPLGTPVRALGNGTVTFAGMTSTGGGNMVKISHLNNYQTAYLHLRGFAKGIRKGVRVSQGQVIGYVGSTGVSTGPHLDFRVWRNGTPIDPLRMESPAASHISKEYKPVLDSLYSKYSVLFDD